MQEEPKLFTKSLPAFLARTQFGQILERVSKHHDRFLVTKNGEAKAIIMGVEDFLHAIAKTPEALSALQQQARHAMTKGLPLLEREPHCSFSAKFTSQGFPCTSRVSRH